MKYRATWCSGACRYGGGVRVQEEAYPRLCIAPCCGLRAQGIHRVRWIIVDVFRPDSWTLFPSTTCEGLLYNKSGWCCPPYTPAIVVFSPALEMPPLVLGNSSLHGAETAGGVALSRPCRSACNGLPSADVPVAGGTGLEPPGLERLRQARVVGAHSQRELGGLAGKLSIALEYLFFLLLLSSSFLPPGAPGLSSRARRLREYRGVVEFLGIPHGKISSVLRFIFCFLRRRFEEGQPGAFVLGHVLGDIASARKVTPRKVWSYSGVRGIGCSQCDGG